MSASPHLELGVGVIATGGIDRLWDEIADLVDVVEVEPQTLWGDAGSRRINRAALDWVLARDRPLLSHGVGYPVGGTTAPERDGVRASARSASELGASHWSEHLSFNQAAGPDGRRYAGYLLPPIPTPEAAAAAIAHIGVYQDQRDEPFLVETPTSYLSAVPGDLTDGEFVAAIAEGADCGILLDLHNIWANELNGRQSVEDFLDQIPLKRVREVHVAGGDYLGECYLDSHVGPVAPEVLELARRALPRLPNVRAVLFEAVPHSIAQMGVTGLRRVLTDIHTVVAAAGRPPSAAGQSLAVEQHPAAAGPTGRSTIPPVHHSRGDTARREAELLGYTTRASDELPDDDPGAEVLRHLTDQARLSLLVGTHRAALAALMSALGPAAARGALNEFLATTPATAWPQEQGAAFDDWFLRFAGAGRLTAPDGRRHPSRPVAGAAAGAPRAASGSPSIRNTVHSSRATAPRLR
ncbi:DUF692 domain-containing protein [Segeticoccus rhizosphaerae]|uniref:DUF692 domain-containing protein n=1 Tax=Segeticoccus rhizosphaerae TaxID=1104777 RepID=UPI0010BFC751|nr:DUF692 family multinuclear iron-containing protein [Ornithinicoccus soli]